ncbi:YkvI family membrane protein [Bacillus sp. Marseille-P3661]|uniref:YkvI family membrane protein n=1 Tax=Bacillus sp. Marseille-P3661 TaxID=1936234 RepID=UPI000C81A856|nr:GerAB/ArcD/ProY family transporter [Bacillus sp. Marseille-P3661]
MIRAGLKWMFLIMGTMIGAGYASGRELWQFFGYESVLAIILFTVLFSICCIVIMKLSYKKKSVHYLPILEDLLGKRLASIYDLLVILYLFTVTVVMLAGGGATLEMFYLPYWTGIAVMVVVLVLLFFWDVKGMVSINVIILPFLIIGLVSVLIFFSKENGQPWVIDWTQQTNWPAAFTFTALNILPLVAVLAAIGKEIKNEGEIWIASIGSGILLGSISLLYNESLLIIASDIVLYEIPLFAIMKNYPYIMLIFMSLVLWGAIYTTAASGVFGLATRFRERTSLPLWAIALILLAVMVPLTTFGFSTLIAVLYPLYGLLNLYLLASILLYPIANRYKWD